MTSSPPEDNPDFLFGLLWPDDELTCRSLSLSDPPTPPPSPKPLYGEFPDRHTSPTVDPPKLTSNDNADSNKDRESSDDKRSVSQIL
eukprot:CAMPEP_0172517756 /NCGR_PEP_ID=MMETSP1066-20121228/287751_1 /TAXON_ID=671091 /ORGANISM="Coscinodiscus wailesii, Strain CCMP2513" /LENGTH=86 /DNA_ID=CAMNT_0013299919 /DNA_START=18 /DNA_END=278 /DNA_ORIENTATION=-